MKPSHRISLQSFTGKFTLRFGAVYRIANILDEFTMQQYEQRQIVRDIRATIYALVNFFLCKIMCGNNYHIYERCISYLFCFAAYDSFYKNVQYKKTIIGSDVLSQSTLNVSGCSFVALLLFELFFYYIETVLVVLLELEGDSQYPIRVSGFSSLSLDN